MTEEPQMLEPIAVDGTPAAPEPVEPPPTPAPEAPLADLKTQVAALDTIAKKFAAVGNSLVATEAANEAMNRVRDALLDKVEASRPSFQFQLIRPFVQRLANLADSLADWGRSPPTDADGFAKCLEAINRQMREILSLHGILEVRPAEGDALDARSHFVAETRPTADLASHEKIAALIEHGYQYIGQHDRSGLVTATLIRPARVVTWKHDPNAASEP
jgi:molecular chaperone GrpE (heat shock protein)